MESKQTIELFLEKDFGLFCGSSNKQCEGFPNGIIALRMA
jgi:hypothetical protein